MRLRRTRILVAVVAVLGALVASAGMAPSAGAATVAQPVDFTNMPDPGVTLYQNNFYAFTTGSFGLWESRASTAAGPWTPARNVLNTSSIPSWVDTSEGVWAPDMVNIPGTSEFAVYFAAVLNTSVNSGPTETPVSGTRCIGVALATSPTGPYTIQSRPMTCLEGYNAWDDMTAFPGNRQTGNGVIDPQAVIVNNSWDNNTNELFLVYKTQSGNGQATIRMVPLDLSTDGTSTIGDSGQILSAVPTGSGGSYVYADTVEGPNLLPLPDGNFLLFVAQGNFDSCNYTTQWFKSSNPWSFNNNGGTTIQSQSLDDLCGPGGGSSSLSEVAGQYRWFYHAYPGSSVGSTRQMYADTLTIGANDTPSLSPITPGGVQLPGTQALFDPISGNFEVYATGTDGTLDEDFWNKANGWSGVFSLGGSITGEPSVTYDPYSGNLEVYARGTDGTVDENFWNGTKWSGFVSLGGAITGSPSALADAISGNLEVYATGTGGDLQVDIWNPNGGWTGWESMGGSLASSPAAINDTASGQTEVYATGSGGDLEVDSWNKNTFWSGLQSLGGSITGTPSPLYDTDTGNLEVYVRGSGGDLQSDAWTWNGWHGLGSLGGSIVGNPSAVNDYKSGNTEVYATGSGNDLQEDAWSASGGWHGLGSLGGTGTVDPSPTAAYDQVSGNMEVYVTDTSGQLEQDAWTGSWTGLRSFGGSISAQ